MGDLILTILNLFIFSCEKFTAFFVQIRTPLYYYRSF